QLLDALLELVLGDDDLAYVWIGLAHLLRAGIAATGGHPALRPTAAPRVTCEPYVTSVTERRPSLRAIRRPPSTSHALASRRATFSTRSTSAAVGGCSPRSSARTARRASGSGPSRKAAASVVSMAA